MTPTAIDDAGREAVAAMARELTVIVPAYNEAASLPDTLRSLQAQTVAIRTVIVVDDRSTDGTGEIARAMGATVLRPLVNTGSKAGAQNFALPFVDTAFTMALDADTALAPDAVERLLAAFLDDGVSAACGSVVPRHRRTIWERGRHVEYLLAFSFYKQVQDYYGSPLIASGCFSAYRTSVLKALGGWSSETVAEDMDLTWRLYFAGHRVRFVFDAVCYPIEPHDYTFLQRQLRRWSHGFVQNLRLHRHRLLDVPVLRSMVGVALWDAVVTSLAYLVLLPLLALTFRNPLFLLGYVVDVPVLLVPVLAGARATSGIGQALASVPAFLVIRLVNCLFILEAIWNELIRRRPLLVFEKGH